MASNYFTINPTSGSGNGTIRVTPVGNNNTTEERKAIVTIKDKSVTIRQYGIPCISGSTSISAPAAGNTYQIEVHTRYDVQFRYKPDWITIDDGQGNYITSAQTISSSVANGHTYNLTVSPNASNDTRSASTTFGMYHYLHSNLQTNYVQISVSQAAGAEDYLTITPTSALDWDDTNAKVINIQANVAYTTSNSNNTDFTMAGGNGYVTIRANDVNSGTTVKTTTISVVSTKASFPYTATCVVTQYRQPRINVVGGGTVPNTGGTKYVEVTSDYYWWLSPTVVPDTNAYYQYISMSAKTSDMNMSPVPSGHTYSLDFEQNDGISIRNVGLYAGYLKLDNSTTGRSSQSAVFTQDTIVSDTLTVTPSRIPETGYASSGGGVYTLQVTTNRVWGLNSIPDFCTVSPTEGTGDTTVTVTIPPATRSGSSYTILGNITFRTNDGGQLATETVPVYQYDNYVAPTYIILTPNDFEVSSASSSYTYSVSASTNWSAGTEFGWITLDTPTTGTSGYTTNRTFSVAQNNSGSSRSASIIFTAGTKYSAITITQSAGTQPVEAPYLVLITKPSAGIVFNSGSTGSIGKTLQVSANTSWVVSSKPDWISLSNSPFGGVEITGGTSGNSIMYPKSAENSGASRSGYVTISGSGLTATSALISQSAGTQTPTYDDIYIENEEGDLTNLPATGCVIGFIYENDGANAEDWEINYDDETDEWAKFYNGPNPSQADEVALLEAGDTGYVYLSVSPNGGSSRNGSITLFGVGSSRTKTITLHQNG